MNTAIKLYKLDDHRFIYNWVLQKSIEDLISGKKCNYNYEVADIRVIY